MLRRVVRIWEEVRSTDGSSRLRRQKTLTLSGGGFCLSGIRRVRIWEELALASDGSSRLRREIIPALLGRDYLFVRNQAGEDLGRV